MTRRPPLDADHPAYDPSACGPDGYPQCRRCLRQIVPPRRGQFCSNDCQHDFLMRVSGSYVRKMVFARDHGVCTHCRMACGQLDRVIYHLAHWGTEEDPQAGNRLALRAIAALGFGNRQRVISLWQADHRVTVAEGGRDCGLGNYRTLCLNCHALQTKELHRRMRQRRREEAG